jgi:DNA-binding SARP family transcriptional activator
MELQPARAIEIPRSALLSRLQRASPKILALVAPAGFGKTTLVRQFLSLMGGPHAVCDCHGVRDEIDFARRVIPALAALSPEREENLRRRELMLGDAAARLESRIDLALEVWREPSPGIFVFENAEEIAERAPAREFFINLLIHRDHGRAIVICSRTNLRIHLTRFAAPHEITMLYAHDLAFDGHDVQAIFEGQLDDPSLDRIMTVSQGWPIAVLSLRRFAEEGRIAPLLDRLDDVAFEQLHDYLGDEVLSSVSADLRNALFIAACIPRAGAGDLHAAGLDGPDIRELSEFAKASAFATHERDGTHTVHPLLASMLLEGREDDRSELLRRVALAKEREHDFQRAAELHLARGDQEAAAHALGRHEVVRDRTPSMRYAHVLASLDRALVQRFPRLWGVTAMLRLYCAPAQRLLGEAESLWRTIPESASPVERFYILVFRVVLLTYVGRLDEALAAVDTFTHLNELSEFLLYLRGIVLARMGRLAEGEEALQNALPVVEHMDPMAAGAYVTMAVDIARVRGEAAIERQLLERAIERAQTAGLENFVAFGLAEAVFGAWLAGDDDAAANYAVRLEETVHRFGTDGFRYFCAAARGYAAEPSEFDMPKYVVFGHLLRAASEPRYARAALDAAYKTQAPFDATLAALAVALTDADAREEHLRIARAAAAKCGEPVFDSICKRLTARLSRSRADMPPPIEIEVAQARVAVHGARIELAGKELELLIAIALQREATSREQLESMLWPDIDEDSARNSLNVCLHRLRQHLGREDSIVHDADGYRVHPQARVDLWEVERAASVLRSRRPLNAEERSDLQKTWERLRARRPGRLRQSEWFERTERRLGELRVAIAQRLANDALAGGDADSALEFSSDIIAYDPCDEPAQEIAIRANLLRGDRAAAMRQFRQYRQTLHAELQCEPSPALAAMLTA